MQHGVPCISTYEGGVSGIIDDGRTGLLAERMDAEDLAAKMAVLLDDKALRERMGNAGRRRFEREFTLRTFEERICEVLEAMV